MSADVIKSFLISLGFSVDPSGQKRFSDSIDAATKSAAALATGIVAAEALVLKGVDNIAKAYESMYYSAQAMGDTIEDIKAFSYAMGQSGVSAEHARSALESFKASMRNNPGVETQIANSMGVSPEAFKRLKASEQLIGAIRSKWFTDLGTAQQNQFLAQWGVDEPTKLAIQRGIEKISADYKAHLKKIGLDTDLAGKKSVEFSNAWRKAWNAITDQIDLASVKFGDKWLGKLEEFSNWIDAHSGEIQTALETIGNTLFEIGKNIWEVAKAVGGWLHSADEWGKSIFGINALFSTTAALMLLLAWTRIPQLIAQFALLFAAPAFRALLMLAGAAVLTGVGAVAGAAALGLAGVGAVIAGSHPYAANEDEEKNPEKKKSFFGRSWKAVKELFGFGEAKADTLPRDITKPLVPNQAGSATELTLREILDVLRKQEEQARSAMGEAAGGAAGGSGGAGGAGGKGGDGGSSATPGDGDYKGAYGEKGGDTRPQSERHLGQKKLLHGAPDGGGHESGVFSGGGGKHRGQRAILHGGFDPLKPSEVTLPHHDAPAGDAPHGRTLDQKPAPAPAPATPRKDIDSSGRQSTTRGWWTPDRQAHAYSVLREGGLSDAGARGLISRWKNVEAPAGPGSVGGYHNRALGIGQWLGDRRQKLIGAGATKDFDKQLKFVLEELKTSEKSTHAAERLRNAKTDEEGAIAATTFERAGGWNWRTGRDNFTNRTREGMAGVLANTRTAEHFHKVKEQILKDRSAPSRPTVFNPPSRMSVTPGASSSLEHGVHLAGLHVPSGSVAHNMTNELNAKHNITINESKTPGATAKALHTQQTQLYADLLKNLQRAAV